MGHSDVSSRTLICLLATLVSLVAGELLLPPPALAASGLTLVVDAPAHLPAGAAAGVGVTVTDTSGAAVAGQPVVLTQALPDGSTAQHPGTTDAVGRAIWSVPLTAGVHTFTAATPAGDTSAGVVVTAYPDTVQLAVTTEPPTWAQTRGQARITVTRTPYGGAATPWPGARVAWQRRTAQGWVPAGSATTGPQGTVTAGLRPGLFRALVDPTGVTSAASTEFRMAGPSPVKVRLQAPARARAGTSLRLRVSTEGAAGRRAKVVLQARGSGRWQRVRRTTTRRDAVVLRHRPVYDVRYRARVVLTSGGKSRGFTSPAARVHLTPTVQPFRPPAGAPEPRRRVPAQPRATQLGPAPVIRPIDDRTWRSMVGRSWRPGCPVGRSDLRLLRVNYYGFDGYRHRGEIVVHRNAVGRMAKAMSLLHQHKVLVRSVSRVDWFGWSSRLSGADDYASMAAGNTSAFNCRSVVGRPGRRSPHSWGRSLDLNPWENPYYSPADGWVPNRWYREHTAGVQTWRSRDHLVVRLMRSAGLRWSYGVLDSHHFDG